ncbi:MAG: hypothetical protein SPL30_10195 [Succinivibrio sp.]|nr:hypothetical protein [Succinivibrio sp.]
MKVLTSEELTAISQNVLNFIKSDQFKKLSQSLNDFLNNIQPGLIKANEMYLQLQKALKSKEFKRLLSQDVQTSHNESFVDYVKKPEENLEIEVIKSGKKNKVPQNTASPVLLQNDQYSLKSVLFVFLLGIAVNKATPLTDDLVSYLMQSFLQPVTVESEYKPTRPQQSQLTQPKAEDVQKNQSHMNEQELKKDTKKATEPKNKQSR